MSLKQSLSEQLWPGTSSYQPWEVEEMKTTEEPCIVLEFSGAQISPHSYTDAKKDGIVGRSALQKRTNLLKFKKLNTAAQYLQNSGWLEVVLFGQWRYLQLNVFQLK